MGEGTVADRLEILRTLVDMSRRLGDPLAANVILGEGNTSAKVDAETFFVKASGTQLPTIGPDGFCEVRTEPLLALLEGPDLDDTQVKEALQAACVDPEGLRPSVETILHASLLSLPEIRFVGHTHPEAVNAILCAKDVTEALTGRLFPDEIVVCGPASVYVQYVDPGLPLARVVRDKIAEYAEAWGMSPKVILMQNHGLIAIGASARDVENITAMASKAARILLGTHALGGPNFLSPSSLARISARPDEKYRQAMLSGR